MFLTNKRHKSLHLLLLQHFMGRSFLYNSTTLQRQLKLIAKRITQILLKTIVFVVDDPESYENNKRPLKKFAPFWPQCATCKGIHWVPQSSKQSGILKISGNHKVFQWPFPPSECRKCPLLCWDSNWPKIHPRWWDQSQSDSTNLAYRNALIALSPVIPMRKFLNYCKEMLYQHTTICFPISSTRPVLEVPKLPSW